tara:strand:+ start:3837 stop:4580 length:744 start_codon:yes stop_codon:yes gene_type:complete
MKNFGIIIEARTGSTRLPNKIIKKIGKVNVLEYLIDRVKKQKKIKKIIIATTKRRKDYKLIKIAKTKKIRWFQGEENDLIKRVIDASKKNNLENIIQVTADNPFFDIKIFNLLLKKFESGKYVFVSNSIDGKFPIGSDIRIFSLNALMKYSKFVKGKARQHTCYYFLKNKEKINSFTLKAKKNYKRPYYRLTIDYPKDFELAKKIILNFGKNYCGLEKIIKYLDNNKKLSSINSNFPKFLNIPKYKK